MGEVTSATYFVIITNFDHKDRKITINERFINPNLANV